MRKMKRVLCVILAVISIFVMDIDTVSEVQAASTGKYFGYDTYVDLVEARGIGAGAVKVNATDKSDVVSGFDVNNNLIYYTYAELAESIGYVIPSSCEKLLVTMGGVAFVGYRSDGSKEIIYRTDGYDNFGYDKNGCDRNGNKFGEVDKSNEDKTNKKITIACVVFMGDIGYDGEFQYKDMKKLTYKLTSFKNKKNQFCEDGVYDTEGHILNEEHYSINAVPKNVDKYGHGTYVITVTTDGYYDNVKFTKTVTVIPQQGVESEVLADRFDNNYIYNVRYYIPSSYYKKNGIEGYEYKVGPLKAKKVIKNNKTVTVFEEGKFANNYKKGSVKFDKKNIKTFANAIVTEKGFPIVTYAKEDRHIAYECKCRSYVLVNGKKIYSQWHISVSIPRALKNYDLKGFD